MRTPGSRRRTSSHTALRIGRSVAKELCEWSIDEVSTLGTAQDAALLREAHERGAVVIARRDDKQFQSVAHGSALELDITKLRTNVAHSLIESCVGP